MTEIQEKVVQFPVTEGLKELPQGDVETELKEEDTGP